MTLSFSLRLIAWGLLVALAVVTLGPIALRPESGLPVQVERALALAIIGFAFALAYPRHVILVAAIVLGATLLLEALQLVAPSRHGRLVDVSVKLVGGLVGIIAGEALNRLARRS